MYNVLREDTEFKIELSTNATVYMMDPFENSTMTWIYDWEFDLTPYYVNNTRNQRQTLPKNQTVTFIAGNNNTIDTADTNVIFALTYYTLLEAMSY